VSGKARLIPPFFFFFSRGMLLGFRETVPSKQPSWSAFFSHPFLPLLRELYFFSFAFSARGLAPPFCDQASELPPLSPVALFPVRDAEVEQVFFFSVEAGSVLVNRSSFF